MRSSLTCYRYQLVHYLKPLLSIIHQRRLWTSSQIIHHFLIYLTANNNGYIRIRNHSSHISRSHIQPSVWIYDRYIFGKERYSPLPAPNINTHTHTQWRISLSRVGYKKANEITPEVKWAHKHFGLRKLCVHSLDCRLHAQHNTAMWLIKRISHTKRKPRF